MSELSSLINSQKAKCLRGYASTIDCLVKYVMHNEDLKFPTLNIIIAGSETLHEDTRYNVKKYMKCNIISQYANEECGILAQERIESKDNIMYLNNASYFFEFLKIESDEQAQFGELARIVITDLYNYAFPIIRYDTGDVGVVLPPNEYSNGYPVLGKLYGRRLDICYTVNNEPFSPMALGRIFKNLFGILQWQFIQIDKAKYLIKIIKDNNEYLNVETMLSYVKGIVGDEAKIDVEFVNEIPILASGKRKMVVNQWIK